jgi:pyruvate,water dikinase
VLRLARRQIPLREVGKAAFLQCIDVCRAAARTHGAALVAQGALAEVDDVFYLTADELESRLATNLPALVEERHAQREEHLQVRLPDVWKGPPEAIPIGDGAAELDDELTGMAVSPGTVEARARVVIDPEAGIDIEPGEVLVCATTDPSWASYFLVASALVIDIGGAMSHGAIVARELGVPCVINTRIGTRAIATGDLIRVDGDAGRVTVLDRGDQLAVAV